MNQHKGTSLEEQENRRENVNASTVRKNEIQLDIFIFHQFTLECKKK